MHKIIFALSLLSIFTSCGRSQKKTAVMLPAPETNLKAKQDPVTINVTELRDGDWDLTWLKWKLSCSGDEFFGIKIENAVLEFSDEAIVGESCVLGAFGTVSVELKTKYVSKNEIFYSALVTSIKAGSQTVLVTKTYGVEHQPMSEDLVAVTKAGDKCENFNAEAFECN